MELEEVICSNCEKKIEPQEICDCDGNIFNVWDCKDCGFYHLRIVGERKIKETDQRIVKIKEEVKLKDENIEVDNKGLTVSDMINRESIKVIRDGKRKT